MIGSQGEWKEGWREKRKKQAGNKERRKTGQEFKKRTPLSYDTSRDNPFVFPTASIWVTQH